MCWKYLPRDALKPLAILVARVKKIGKNPSVIRKYYKSIDEHLMIKKYFENLIVEK